jgi:hypothetical protein
MCAKFVGTANINQKHDHQFAFLVEYFEERRVEPGGYIPINITDIVAKLVLAHFAESHATAFKSTVVMPGKNIPRQAPGLDLNTPDFLKNLRGFHCVSEFM